LFKFKHNFFLRTFKMYDIFAIDMEIERKGGAILGRKTNKRRRQEAEKRQEIRIYSPDSDMMRYIEIESERMGESKSLIAYSLIKDGIIYRATKNNL
jgi:hypothetical protein